MIFSLVYISYAFTGWNGASYLAGEIEQPQRKLPIAILSGTAFVLVLYLALNGFYALALTAEQVRAIDDVAPIAQLSAEQLFGPRVADPLSVAIGFTLLASLSAFVLTGPRVAFAMAQAGQFPAIAGRLSERTGTPRVATALQIGWSLVLLWTGSFEQILVYSSVGLALFSMLTVSAVYVLRWKRPDLHRPFRTPGYPVVPAIYLAVTLLLTLAVLDRQPLVGGFSVLSIALGIPVYYLAVRKAGFLTNPDRDV